MPIVQQFAGNLSGGKSKIPNRRRTMTSGFCEWRCSLLAHQLAQLFVLTHP